MFMSVLMCHAGKSSQHVSMRQIRKLQQEKKTLQQEQEECGEQSLQQQQLQIRKDQIHEMDAAKQQTQQLRRGLKQPPCQHIQQVEQRDHVIAARCFVTERDVQLQELSQQLAASEQVVAELQQNLQWKEGKIQELQKEIQHLQLKLRENTVMQQLMTMQKRKLSLSWIPCKSAPHKMRRGSAAVCAW